jgi:hypothetical protein
MVWSIIEAWELAVYLNGLLAQDYNIPRKISEAISSVLEGKASRTFN